MPTFLTCYYRKTHCSDIFSHSYILYFALRSILRLSIWELKTCSIVSLPSILKKGSPSGDQSRDTGMRCESYSDVLLELVDEESFNCALYIQRNNGLFHSRGGLDSPVSWKSPFFFVSRSHLLAQRSRKEVNQLTKPIFFLKDFCKKKFFLTLFREKK